MSSSYKDICSISHFAQPQTFVPNALDTIIALLLGKCICLWYLSAASSWSWRLLFFLNHRFPDLLVDLRMTLLVASTAEILGWFNMIGTLSSRSSQGPKDKDCNRKRCYFNFLPQKYCRHLSQQENRGNGYAVAFRTVHCTHVSRPYNVYNQFWNISGK